MYPCYSVGMTDTASANENHRQRAEREQRREERTIRMEDRLMAKKKAQLTGQGPVHVRVRRIREVDFPVTTVTTRAQRIRRALIG